MFITRFSAAALVAMLAAPPCWVLADELHVPSQYPTIQAAVSASQAGDEIILADGVYTGAGNHDITMPGHMLTLRSASGDPEACVIQMRDVYLFSPERAFTFSSSASSGTVVRGISIAGGSGRSRGGGVLIQGASPVFEDCIFVGNWAYGEPCSPPTHGGGVYMSNSNAVFERCAFIGNSVGPDVCAGTSRGNGGGVYVAGGSPSFIDCEFERNSAYGDHVGAGYGGGMYVASGNVLLQRTRFDRNTVVGIDGVGYGGAIWTSGTVVAIGCEFAANTARGMFVYGGAIAVGDGSLDLVNCRLLGNRASSFDWGALGGAIYASGGQTTITNSLLADNEVIYGSWCDPSDRSGAFGAALCLGGGASVIVQSSTLVGNSSGASTCGGDVAYLFGPQTLEIANSIIWGSGADPIATFEPGATIQITFSNVEGGWPGAGNIDADPIFVDPGAGDYALDAGSPCIDAGDNTAVPSGIITDLAGQPRFVDDPATPDTGVPGGAGGARIVDMGAYEFQGDFCYADCDGSGELDFFDFLCFQSAFAAGEPYADCDGSGSFDFFDFLCFQNAFAAGCP